MTDEELVAEFRQRAEKPMINTPHIDVCDYSVDAGPKKTMLSIGNLDREDVAFLLLARTHRTQLLEILSRTVAA